VSSRSHAFVGRDRRPHRLTLRDITERKQAIDERKRAGFKLAGEKRLLEMVASGCALSDVLTGYAVLSKRLPPNPLRRLLDRLERPETPRGRRTQPSATFNDPLCELPVRCEMDRVGGQRTEGHK